VPLLGDEVEEVAWGLGGVIGDMFTGALDEYLTSADEFMGPLTPDLRAELRTWHRREQMLRHRGRPGYHFGSYSGRVVDGVGEVRASSPTACDSTCASAGCVNSGDRDSMAHEDMICRICLSGDDPSQLRAPCACRGSQKLVHIGCLRKAFASRGDLTSLVCGVCERRFVGDAALACAELAVHTIALRVATSPTAPQELWPCALNNLAQVLADTGRLQEAEALHREALGAKEDSPNLGPDHPSTYVSAGDLADVLSRQGRQEEAEAMFRTALAGFERLRGPDDPSTLAASSGLGSCLRLQGRSDEAEPLQLRALEGFERLARGRGGNHETSAAMHNLGGLLELRGHFDQAAALHRRALKTRERELGPEHPDTLASSDRLAGALVRCGHAAEAERLHRRVLECRAMALGEGHPDTLASANNLAFLLRERGAYREAEVLNRQAFNGLDLALGPEHPETLMSADSLAVIIGQRGDHLQAERLARCAFDGLVRAFGPVHPSSLAVGGNLACHLEALGRPIESEALHRRALAGLKETSGDDHPDTLAARANLAGLLARSGRTEEAEALLRQTLAALDANASHTASNDGGPGLDTDLAASTVCDGLARLLLLPHAGSRAAAAEEAEALVRRAADGLSRALGPEHPQTFLALAGLAVAQAAVARHRAWEAAALTGRHCTMGRRTDDTDRGAAAATAAVLFRRALDGLDATLGPDDPATLAIVRDAGREGLPLPSASAGGSQRSGRLNVSCPRGAGAAPVEFMEVD